MSDNPYALTKRTAKNEACFRAAMALENALEGGWETMDKYGEDGRVMVVDGVQQIITELLRRAGRSLEAGAAGPGPV